MGKALDPDDSTPGLKFKIIGGTVTDAHLCHSCQHGKTRVTAHGAEESRCQVFSNITRRMVVKCDAYKPHEEPPPLWMLGMAQYIYKTPYGKVHFLTEAQMDDYHYLQTLLEEERPKRKRSLPKKRKARKKISRNPRTGKPLTQVQMEMFI